MSIGTQNRKKALPVLEDELTPIDNIQRALPDLLREHGELRGLHIVNCALDLDAVEAPFVDFSGCLFERCTVTLRSSRRCGFTDVEFRNCDLSNANFHKSTFIRALLSDSKALGANFSEAILRGFTARGGILRYSNLTACKLTNVFFEDSDLTQAALEDCKLAGLDFDHCNLQGVTFSFTALKDIDLTTCDLQGIRANPGDLRGAIIAAHQAVDLAALLGVVIR